MMQSFTTTIKQLIVEHGVGIIQQEQRIKAIFADLHPSNKKMAYLLDLSLRAEIPKKLITIQNEELTTWTMQISSIKHYFKDEYFLDDGAVKTVFNWWMTIIPCKFMDPLYVSDFTSSKINNKQPIIRKKLSKGEVKKLGNENGYTLFPIEQALETEKKNIEDNIPELSNPVWSFENLKTYIKGGKMKRSPNYIILKQALRYLPESEKNDLINKLSTFKNLSKPFFNCLKRNFDIEVFRTKPLIWQDIWLYNYIKYEVEDKLKRNGLIAKYAREVFIEDDLEFFAMKDVINSKML